MITTDEYDKVAKIMTAVKKTGDNVEMGIDDYSGFVKLNLQIPREQNE